MLQKNDMLLLISKIMNEDQTKFAQIKSDLTSFGVDKIYSGKETIDSINAIYNSRRDLLDKIYREVQSM